ncbi:MAG TPA: class I SAM-dependent methyltransferase [Pirellulales bacterium]|nr:class I SAM-dependent methyltransferase [Pirellulales bacterium]
MKANEYALGTTAGAARRLEIQDAQFAAISEELLDRLNVRPSECVVEMGSGAGSFTRRILRRLGSGGVLVGVDYSQELLDQAASNLRQSGDAARASSARLELVRADISDMAAHAAAADALVGRTVLHHLAFPELLFGQWRAVLKPGARLGFIEPEFRALMARLAALETRGRKELAPLRRWAEGISRYYQARGLAPCIGATLGRSLEVAGYRRVHSQWSECPTDEAAIENMLLYYDEIREKYASLGIMTSNEIDDQQRLLSSLSTDDLPAVWGTYSVTCVA